MGAQPDLLLSCFSHAPLRAHDLATSLADYGEVVVVPGFLLGLAWHHRQFIWGKRGDNAPTQQAGVDDPRTWFKRSTSDARHHPERSVNQPNAARLSKTAVCHSTCRPCCNSSKSRKISESVNLSIPAQ